jgi:hypothetical protein
MKESEAQNDQGTMPPVSGLTRRLLQRADTVGVIDLRPAVAMYARSNNWLAQRAELAKTLQNRYGGNQPEVAAEPAAYGTGNIAFGAAPQRFEPVLPAEVFATPLSVSRNPVHTLATSLAPQRTPTLQYRVKRPNISEDLGQGPSKSAFSSAAAMPTPVAAAKVKVSPNSGTATQVQRKAHETPVSRSDFPQASRLSPADAVTATPYARVEAKAAPLDGPSTARPFLQVSELPRVAAVPMHLQRMPDVLPTGEMPVRTPDRSSDGTASYETASTRETSSAQEASGETAAYVAALPLDRKPNPQVLTVSPAPSKTEMVFAKQMHGVLSRAPGTVSREIRSASTLPASTRMLWRKAESNGTARDGAATGALAGAIATATAAPPRIMRDADSEPASTGVTSAAQPQESNGVDVSYVADQVSRILAHRFRVERERRGMTK